MLLDSGLKSIFINALHENASDFAAQPPGGQLALLAVTLMVPRLLPSFLSGLIQREIIYRVLRGRVRARLRAVATLGDQSHRTAKVITWITANYAKPLRQPPMRDVRALLSPGAPRLESVSSL
jgi:hypothetical protein